VVGAYACVMEYRTVVVGGGGCGKSAITVRFVQGNFVEKYDPTIEDSYRKQLDVDGVACMLDVMDTAGQEEYSALRDSYMKTGQGFVLVYDITSATSFDLATKLHTQILRLKEESPDIPIVLVGNYCDMEKIRKVPSEKARAFAERHGLGFMEVSPKTNTNIVELFMELVRRIRTWRERNPEFGYRAYRPVRMGLFSRVLQGWHNAFVPRIQGPVSRGSLQHTQSTRDIDAATRLSVLQVHLLEMFQSFKKQGRLLNNYLQLLPVELRKEVLQYSISPM